MTDIENRILCILGPTFYKGVGRPENGVRILQQFKESNEMQIPSQIPNLSKDVPSNEHIGRQQHSNHHINTTLQQAPRLAIDN